MSGTYEVEVRRAEAAAVGIQLFELRSPGGGLLPEFAAGAHIGVKVPNGEIRKYSLCNEPAERHRYVIAVKREAEGRGGSVSDVDHRDLVLSDWERASNIMICVSRVRSGELTLDL